MCLTIGACETIFYIYDILYCVNGLCLISRKLMASLDSK